MPCLKKQVGNHCLLGGGSISSYCFTKWLMVCVQTTYILWYPLQLETRQDIILEILMICKLYNAKTQLYFNSFLHSVIREWNELPQPTSDSTSISSFKYRLDSIETKPPSYYYEGKRLGQIYHTRLRTGCKSLNQHLFSKNIVDSSLCDCGSIEDTTHYFLNCTRYNNIRHQMFNSVSRFCSPTLHTLLYRNSNLTNEQNKSIMTAVQEFITQSERFKIQ